MRCELAAVGYREISFDRLTGSDAYVAIFAPPSVASRTRPDSNSRVQGAVADCITTKSADAGGEGRSRGKWGGGLFSATSFGKNLSAAAARHLVLFEQSGLRKMKENISHKIGKR